MNTFRLLSFLLLPLTGLAGATSEADPAAYITAEIHDPASRKSVRKELTSLVKEFGDAILTLELRLPPVTMVYSEEGARKAADETKKTIARILSLTAPISDPAVRLSAQRTLASFAILNPALPGGNLPAAMDLVELHVPALSRYMVYLFAPEIWKPLKVTVDGRSIKRRVTDHLELRDAIWLADLINEGLDIFQETEEFGWSKYGDPAETVAPVMKAFCIALGVPERRPFPKVTTDRFRAWAIGRCDKALASPRLSAEERAAVITAKTKIGNFKTFLFHPPGKAETQ